MAAKAPSQTAPPISADALGMHNMSVQSGSSVSTQGTLGCTFCHAPHSGIGGNTPLWNQRLSVQSYTTYTSTTYHQQGSAQPTLGASSSLCLSCHDGTVAVGQTQAYGKIPVTGNLNNMDSFGTTLTGSHPFSLVLPIKDAPNLALSVSQGATADPTGAVKLVNGNIECNTCHNPHSQYIDPIAQNFLVKDSSNGKLCTACHDPMRVVTGQVNQLAGWQGSVHATATNQVASTGNVGLYPTVSVNACSSCHMEHNAPSPARLLRPATPAATSIDPSTQDCITCHSSTSGSSSSNNSYINPVPPPVYNEVAKMYSHPIPSGNNGHDAAETVVLNNNRHATCVDCHNPHATQATILPFPNPPTLRLPQTSVTGLSALDGLTLLNPAVNQYENCLRCHGPSLGKQGSIKYGYLPTRFVFATDALNVLPQFSPSATSSHPVMHIRSSAFPQPSLLTNILNIDGITPGRLMGQQIFCTDCHNSDDNREFGGTGPNGPHGSNFAHILERNYQFSVATTPGTPVTNTYPNPDTSSQGPYAMCAKCHNLGIVFSQASTPLSPPAAPLHVTHVQTDGFSCSVCHTAHGMGANSSTVTGERMVNFDVNVVAPNNTIISYSHGTNTCTLVCHGVTHNADGSVH